jgi:dsRNA-specific ribonuclease
MDNSDETQEGIEVPKVLADLFEAVIGAVFVDCGQDEEKTWHVVFPLLQATLGERDCIWFRFKFKR